jgi:hypothetical protein
VGLTQAQRSIVAKAQSVGGSKQGVALDDEACAYLVAVIAHDLGLHDRVPGTPSQLPAFFGTQSLASLRLPGAPFLAAFEALVGLDKDAETYFACLAALHKGRLKYERILQAQPIPTVDQVGPRGLLQYGCLGARALTPFVLWRKWIYDIDNRAAQETGYVFEPIIAAAIGGVPCAAKKSPVKRQSNKAKGRQVDCIRDRRAHEIKLRVTSAALGQGRWKEELEFAGDCKGSGYVPVLVVLSPTPSPKLDELKAKFLAEGGEEHVGDKAWDYLHSQAGPTLTKFLERYVHEPLNAILAEAPTAPEALPDLLLKMSGDRFTATLAGETLTVGREARPEEAPEPDALPEDVDEELPGV